MAQRRPESKSKRRQVDRGGKKIKDKTSINFERKGKSNIKGALCKYINAVKRHAGMR